ncbi:Endoribonuclease YbeY [Roseovarius albus]|uniref:Endoribonuclease YbeY n=1 Tax=Roseovarius albus TaxID=1247867 RepID=A0A1X6ZHG6_9RHOB|nr:rRNA maturation RNase YbeY [Roseovarius albus]SLN51194.1 Endoribonuclease YbeY [Roseovarius albus]
MLTDTIVEDVRWDALDLPALSEQAAQATLKYLGLDPSKFEIVVMGCDDARIAELNADFRDKPQPTNVLSWPSEERGVEFDGDRPELPDTGPDAELGDIAIAYETCLREAGNSDKSEKDHVTHLIVHAVLHLLGYDHIRDKDATLMEGIEVAVLGKLGLEDPY